MRKITVIILILLVLGVLAGCLFMVFNPGDISYVGDYKSVSDDTTQLLIKRLYSSDIDEKKMQELASSTLTSAFTDDEVLEAALKAGHPKYYPWYFFEVNRSTDGETDICVTGQVNQQLAVGQTTTDFVPVNLRMEAVASNGLTISENYEIYGADENDTDAETRIPVRAEDGSSMIVELGGIGLYEIRLNGTSGSLMIQYTYDIATSGTVIPKTVMKDQLLMVTMYFSIDGNGKVITTYDVMDASEISEVY